MKGRAVSLDTSYVNWTHVSVETSGGLVHHIRADHQSYTMMLLYPSRHGCSKTSSSSLEEEGTRRRLGCTRDGVTTGVLWARASCRHGSADISCARDIVTSVLIHNGRVIAYTLYWHPSTMLA